MMTTASTATRLPNRAAQGKAFIGALCRPPEGPFCKKSGIHRRENVTLLRRGSVVASHRMRGLLRFMGLSFSRMMFMDNANLPGDHGVCAIQGRCEGLVLPSTSGRIFFRCLAVRSTTAGGGAFLALMRIGTLARAS